MDLLEAVAERTVGGVRPDVLAYDAEGSLLIEIRVSHRVDLMKRQVVQAKQYRMFEIDLSRVTANEVSDHEKFSHLVLAEPLNRTWVCLPAAEEEWRNALADLKADVDRETLRRLADAKNAELDIGFGGGIQHSGPPRNLPRLMPSPPPHALHSATPGSRIWHRGLGEGTVGSRATESTPAYKVAFDSGKTRTIVLEESGIGTTWRILSVPQG